MTASSLPDTNQRLSEDQMTTAVEARPIVGSWHLRDTSLHIRIEGFDEEWSRKAFHSVMRLLRKIGFAVGRDPDIERRYKTLGPSHRSGRRGELEFKAEYSSRGLEVDFFQNVVFENPYGGHADFDKLAKMPYLIRKRFDWTIAKLRNLLQRMGVTESPREPSFYTEPLENYRHRWGSHPSDFGPDGLLTDRAMARWQQNGRDGIPLRTGDLKYARVRGRLVCGRVHGGINGMWFLLYGVGRIEPKGSFENHNAGAFFSCDHPGQEPRRWFPERYRRGRRAVALSKAIERRDWKRVAVLGPIVDRELAAGPQEPPR